MVNINYYLRETAGKEKPIYLFLGIDKLRLRLSINAKINPTKWNKIEQRPRLPKMEDSVLNDLYNRLNTIKADLTKELSREAKNGTELTENKIRDIAIGCINKDEIKVAPEKETFYSFAQSFIENSKGKKTPGTIKTYNGTITCLKDFESSQKYKIDFDTITLEFFDKFTGYLLNECLRTKNTIGYRIKVIKTIMNEATEKGFNSNLDFKKSGFKKWTEEADTVYLNDAELQKIYDLDLSQNKRLDKVRDLFLIGCYTGLRFSDFTGLGRATITENTIRIRTQKTNEIIEVPKHTIVRQILNKYENEIPKAMSNQKMNEYLKEMGKEAKIEETINLKEAKGGKVVHLKFKKYQKISSHTARRSFATNAYLSGLPTYAIMKITGHETEKAFLKYIKVGAEENARTVQMHPFFNPEMSSNLKAVV